MPQRIFKEFDFTMMEMEKVYEQASAAIDELFAAADTLKRGDILVIG